MSSKATHDFYNALKAAYDRSTIAIRPNNFISVCCEFTELLTKSPIAQDVRQKIADEGKTPLKRLSDLKPACLNEIKRTRLLLVPHAASVPTVAELLKKCSTADEVLVPNSYELIDAHNTLLRTACQVLVWEDRDGKYTSTLSQLMKLSPEKRIIEYVFAPSVTLFQEEHRFFDQEKMHQVAYSLHVLIALYEQYKLRGRQKVKAAYMFHRQNSAAAYYDIDTKNLDKIILLYNSDEALAEGFDIDAHRIHLHRVWDYVWQNSPVNEKRSCLLTLKGNTLRANELSTNFKPASASYVILSLLFSGDGKPNGETVTYDDLTDEIESSEDWDPNKDEPNIYEIGRSINKNVAKKLKLPEFLLLTDSVVQINPIYLS